jgi:hypothetical protein
MAIAAIFILSCGIGICAISPDVSLVAKNVTILQPTFTMGTYHDFLVISDAVVVNETENFVLVKYSFIEYGITHDDVIHREKWIGKGWIYSIDS